LYIFVLAASIFSTIFALTGTVSGGWLAVFTAVPGIVLLINSVFNLDERSQWHYEKTRQLSALLRLQQAGAKATSPAEVAEKWNRIDAEMEKQRPKLGTLPTTSYKSPEKTD
jgi:hypothetical protein